MGGGDSPAPPLCVDLDGTLLLSDIGLESVLALLRQRPWLLLALPFWLLGGLASAKRRVAKRVRMACDTLPYDDRVVAWLRQQAANRERVLASASDSLLVEAVANHLGLFDAVIASDGQRNLAGSAKAEALVARYGESGFDYAGNGRADLQVWPHARQIIVANANARVAAAAARIATPSRIFPRQTGNPAALLAALRLHQWLKNLLLFVPMLAAHRWNDARLLVDAGWAWLAFGLCASGTYLLNDLLDLDADRRHPRKRLRPLASGTLDLWQGLALAPLLVALAFALAAWRLPPPFTWMLAAYLVLTLAYSGGFKRVAFIDVIVLAALYTLRLLAGGGATTTPVSLWLISFAMFLFLGLALLKRYTELLDLRERQCSSVAGRGYAVVDLPLVLAFGIGSGLLSVLVLALYIDSAAGEALYHQPTRLVLLCPLLLYWSARAWLIAHRGAMHDDPLVFAARDPASWLLLLLSTGIIWSAI
ncbi:MAG TPA: UbiA family prenyltransferase [Rhodanobacteraceae bacterium]|nr:UbiA family prenyltransferase [Rhodanobacteraceae bacterium]